MMTNSLTSALLGVLCVGFTIGIPSWEPTFLFMDGVVLQQTDGTPIQYSSSVVTRFADLDGNGVLDMLLASDGKVFYYLGDGNGRFSAPQPLQYVGGNIDTGIRGTDKTSIAYTDMDGDEVPDLLLTQELDLYYLKGTSQSNAVPLFGQMVFLKRLDTTRFDVTDWNNDGLNDIMTGVFEGPLFVYYNTGSRSAPTLADFTYLIEIVPGAYTPWPRVMDINGDGEYEVLHSQNWGGFFMYVKNERGVYIRSTMKLENLQAINVRSTYGEHQSPEIADVDGDGLMDLVASGRSGSVVFFKGVDQRSEKRSLIEAEMSRHPSDLGTAMDTNDTLYNFMYDAHNYLHNYMMTPVFPEEEKSDLRSWYVKYLIDYPQYFARRQFSVNGAAQFAGYIWTVVLDCLPDTADQRALVSSLTNHTGFAARILQDRGILIINNNGAPEWKMEIIYDFLMLKDPSLYSLASITQSGFFIGKNSKYGSIRKSGINIFTGAEYGEDSFPADCQVCSESDRNPTIMTFLVALAHEVAHNELDQPLAPAYNQTLFERKYEILRRATEGHVVWQTPTTLGYNIAQTQQLFLQNGWWDGQANWDTTFTQHFQSGPGFNLNFNSIRPSNIDFFVKAPQEAFATLANQYFADSKLMLDFAMERARNGYTLCMDWFILIADYYTKGGTTFPVYVMDEFAEMQSWSATAGRNAQGYINDFFFDYSLGLPGDTDYLCDLDSEGFVVNCSSIKKSY